MRVIFIKEYAYRVKTAHFTFNTTSISKFDIYNFKRMGIVAIAINSMDGRVQIPVIEWLKGRYSVEYVDMITEPGPNKILSENRDSRIVESIKKRVEISIVKHNSKLIAVMGHYGCAGNPVKKDINWNRYCLPLRL